MRSIARAVHAAVLAPGAPRQVIAAGLIELARPLMLPRAGTTEKGANNNRHAHQERQAMTMLERKTRMKEDKRKPAVLVSQG